MYKRNKNKNSSTKGEPSLVGTPDDMDILIPASQENTQPQPNDRRSQIRRFTSQRSQRRMTQQTCVVDKCPYVEQLFQRCGITVINDNYTLTCDLFAAASRLYGEIKRNEEFPLNITYLIDDIDKLLSDKDSAYKLLKNLCVKYKNISLKTCTVSIIKVFLSMSEVQYKLVDALLQHLSKLSNSETEEDVQLFYMILIQFNEYKNVSHKLQLVNKVLNILEKTKGHMREKSIKMIEILVPRRKHSYVLQKLIDIVHDTEELCKPSFIETYLKLNLENYILRRLRIKMLDYLNEGAQKRLIPGVIKFILFSLVDDHEEISTTINELRKILNAKMENQLFQDIFEQIHVCFKRYQLIKQGFINAVSLAKTAKDCSNIDIITLIVIKDLDNSIDIDKLFEQNILASKFDKPLLKASFEHIGFILVDYICSAISLFERLFKNKNLKISNFGAEGFSLLLTVGNGAYERELVLAQIISMICGHTRRKTAPMLNLRHRALVLLLDLKNKFQESRSAYYHVEKMLDYTSYFTISQTRMALDILYSLIYDPPEDLVLKSQHEIIVRKQLTDNMKIAERYQGIVALVRMLNYSVWQEEQLPFSETGLDSLFTISQISSENGRNLAKLLSLTLDNAIRDIPSLCLLYDELAFALSKRNPKRNESAIDLGFLHWLGDRIQNDFQVEFVVDTSPEVIKGFNVIYDECINEVEENESENEEAMRIAVNLSAYLINPNLLTIFSQINLLKNIVVLRYDNDLDPINALLGCALVLPKNFSDIDKLMGESQKFALDIHFLVANWYRELINAFVSSSHSTIRKKVLMRLLRLIEIEQNIKYMLKVGTIDYKPPVCCLKSFQTVNKSVKAGKNNKQRFGFENKKVVKKTKKSKATTNQKKLSKLNSTTSKATAIDFSYSNVEIFRNLDTGIFNLLKETFQIIHPIPDEEKGRGIHLAELRFILEEIFTKFEIYLGIREPHQEIQEATEFVKEFVRVSKNIMSAHQQMITFLLENLKKVDYDYSHPDLHNNELIYYVKSSLCTIWRIFCKLFIWFEYHIDDYSNMMKETCSSLLVEDKIENHSIPTLASSILTVFEKYSEIILDVNSALSLYEFIKVMERISGVTNSSTKLAKILFCREWYAFDHKKESGQLLNKIMTKFITDFASIMRTPEVAEDIQKLKLNLRSMSKDEIFMTKYPNITGKTFSILYKGIGQSLACALNTNLLEAKDNVQQIEEFQISFKLCLDLLYIAKTLNDFKIWTIFLKTSCGILKIFANDGTELIKKTILFHVEEVMKLIKLMQRVTRKCTQICNHGKVLSISSILNLSPQFRYLAETILNNMKNAFAANNLLRAWSIAQLKTKNIYGEVISSQREILEESNNQPLSDLENDNDSENVENETSKVFE